MAAEPENQNAPLKLMVIVGTRPEAIKLAPVILQARKDTDNFETIVVTTGQHREMLDQMLELFGIVPDDDLNIMRPNQDLSHVTTAALEGITTAIGRFKPDVVVVQGDTTTTFAGAMAAFYADVAVAHVEAGLRTHDKRQPWPEEINRRLTTQLADFHFAPTELSKRNLLLENVPDDRVWITGNTAIDALFIALERTNTKAQLNGGDPEVRRRIGLDNATRTILVTAHRRENHGRHMESICHAIVDIVDLYEDVDVLFPVHMSPTVRKTVLPILENRPRVRLVEPLDYEEFVVAMSNSYLILTDSGGVQEEAPSLGKPVLVLRESTERPEAANANVARIVGTDRQHIVSEASRLLADECEYLAMANAINPFGDGHAADQILSVLKEHLPRVDNAD